MWPWSTSAAYQRLLIRFNLTAMPLSYFLPCFLHIFHLPGCSRPLFHSPGVWSPPLPSCAQSTLSAIVIQLGLRGFNPLSVSPSSLLSHWNTEWKLLNAPSPPCTLSRIAASAEILRLGTLSSARFVSLIWHQVWFVERSANELRSWMRFVK